VTINVSLIKKTEKKSIFSKKIKYGANQPAKPFAICRLLDFSNQNTHHDFG